MIRNRGRDNFSTPLACNMFLFIRRNAVNILSSQDYRHLTRLSQIQSHLQISKPMDPIFEGLAETVSLYENVEDRLLSKAMHIPKLQSLANTLLSKPSWAVDCGEALELLRVAEDLDGELADWARRIPAKWSYTTVIRMRYSSDSKSSSSFFIPNQIHRYPDLYAARVWNLYRVYRLITQSILLRVSSFYSTDHEQDYIRIEKINKAMVNDVCASVPFLLSCDLSELKHGVDGFQDEEFLWPQVSMGSGSSGHTGKFSLIWPLYISCSVPSVPDTQRKWIRAQLRWIAETGEAHAYLIQDTESPTLTGGPEYFRFDCV